MIALVPVAAVFAIAFVMNNPAFSPAPAAYRDGACEAVDLQSAAVSELEAAHRAVESGEGSAEQGLGAARRLVSDANDVLGGLPSWSPGQRLTTQLATVQRHVDSAVRTIGGGPETSLDTLPPDEALAEARTILAAVTDSLANGEYGFSCENSADGSPAASP